MTKSVIAEQTLHRFLDETGDTAFWGKGHTLIIGARGVSLSFGIGMVSIQGNLAEIRRQIISLQNEVVADDYFKDIPSIAKKNERGGFYFHATDDPPEIRERFFRFIKQLDCKLEMVIGRKIPSLFAQKHNCREAEFYADLLAHLLKGQLSVKQGLVLNIAARGASTRNNNLQAAWRKAGESHGKIHSAKGQVVFNVQYHKTEPLLNVADYMCWAVHRVFERGELRYYNFLKERIGLVTDIYATTQNLRYTLDCPLTVKNKLSPFSP